MTTTQTTNATYTIENEDGRWLVLDADGDHYDDFATKAQAEAAALRFAANDRVEALRGEIENLLIECEDEGTLDRIKALLGA